MDRYLKLKGWIFLHRKITSGGGGRGETIFVVGESKERESIGELILHLLKKTILGER